MLPGYEHQKHDQACFNIKFFFTFIMDSVVNLARKFTMVEICSTNKFVGVSFIL